MKKRVAVLDYDGRPLKKLLTGSLYVLASKKKNNDLVFFAIRSGTFWDYAPLGQGMWHSSNKKKTKEMLKSASRAKLLIKELKKQGWDRVEAFWVPCCPFEEPEPPSHGDKRAWKDYLVKVAGIRKRKAEWEQDIMKKMWQSVCGLPHERPPVFTVTDLLSHILEIAREYTIELKQQYSQKGKDKQQISSLAAAAP